MPQVDTVGKLPYFKKVSVMSSSNPRGGILLDPVKKRSQIGHNQ